MVLKIELSQQDLIYAISYLDSLLENPEKMESRYARDALINLYTELSRYY